MLGLPAKTHDPSDVRTNFLFTEFSATAGCGRIIDLWGGLDHATVSCSAREADYRAIYADWRMTGQDVRDTIFVQSSLF